MHADALLTYQRIPRWRPHCYTDTVNPKWKFGHGGYLLGMNPLSSSSSTVRVWPRAAIILTKSPRLG